MWQAPTRMALVATQGVVEVRDLLVYRAGLNADERKFLRTNDTDVLQACTPPGCLIHPRVSTCILR